MSHLILRYGEDPTTGLPRLTEPGASLPAPDLEALEREIARNYERLIDSQDGRLFTLDGEAPRHLPRTFRVTVQDRNRRSPTLLFEALEPAGASDGGPTPEAAAAEAPAPAPTGRWQAQFVAEVADLVAEAQGEGAGRPPLEFVLGDLRALLRKDARRFTLLLLAGYLHVGAALGRRYGDGENRYVEAAQVLAEVAGTSLPEGVFGPLFTPPAPGQPAPEPPKQATGWLKKLLPFG